MKRITTVLYLLVVVLSVVPAIRAVDIYVSPGGSGSGLTPLDPIDLQGGLDLAKLNGDNDYIKLQIGFYNTGTGTYWYNSYSNDGMNVTMSGGWNADFSTRTDDPALTVLDGAGTRRVLSIETLHSTIHYAFTIENLTVQNGYPNDENYRGPGIRGFCSAGGVIFLTIRDCIVQNCTGPNNSNTTGAAIYVNCPADIINTVFSGNIGANGGAVYLSTTPVGLPEPDYRIHNCSFDNNSNFPGGYVGASIYNLGSAVISDCYFTGESDGVTSSGYQGAVYCAANSSMDMGGCVFEEHIVASYGSAIVMHYSSGTITNCLLLNNRAGATSVGFGAIRCNSNTNDDVVVITNCTFAGNRSSFAQLSAIYSEYTTLTVSGCIVWDCDPVSMYNRWATSTVSYSNVENGVPTGIEGFVVGPGNINSNPLFVTGPLGDFYLSQTAAGQASNSPCLDAGGEPASSVCYDVPVMTVCLCDLTTRMDDVPDDGTVDMGYHYPGPVIPTPTPTETPTPAPTNTPTLTPTDTPFVTSTPTPPCYHHGDVDLNGSISAGDAQMAFGIVLGSVYPTFEQECAADCNGDGSITAGDAQMIFYAVVGLDACVDPLPTPTPTATPTFPPAPTGFVYIPPGTFLRGSPLEEPCRDNGEAQHQVTLTHGIFVMETEITRQMWADLKVNQPSLPEDPSDTALSPTMNHPVQNNTWYDTVLFANLLSLEEGLTPCYYADAGFTELIDASNYTTGPFYCDFDANGNRLPTEAEWEYSARAGTTGPFSCDEPNYDSNTCWATEPGTLPVLELYALFYGNFSGTIGIAGSKLPNPWDLHDMHGSVCEWNWDWREGYPTGPQTDPTGPETGSWRIIRGGAWAAPAVYARSAYRTSGSPGDHNNYIGFRLVRTVP